MSGRAGEEMGNSAKAVAKAAAIGGLVKVPSFLPSLFFSLLLSPLHPLNAVAHFSSLTHSLTASLSSSLLLLFNNELGTVITLYTYIHD
jgi:hypothetical protein